MYVCIYNKLMNKKDLLAIYLNEFNYKYLLRGARKYKCLTTLKFLNFKKVRTFTKDEQQNYNLDPWVQAVSISTGKSSKIHKIYNLGQPVKKIIQIWDFLCKKKIYCSVWGAMNSTIKNSKYLNFYFPDPWNFNDKSKPIYLMKLYLLPNYYAKNYLRFNIFKFFILAFFFLISLIQNSKLSDFISDIIFSLKIILKHGLKNYILFFLFDIFFMNVVVNCSKKKSQFSLIFLNSIAHFQHNNWNEKKHEETFFRCAERIFKKLEKIKRQYKSIIIFNGFTQRRINNEYILRPIDPIKFLLNFINFKSLEQDMTNGGYIFFKDKKEMQLNLEILDQLYYLNKKIFYIEKFDNKTIFYRINIKSKKILSIKTKRHNLIEIKKNAIKSKVMKKDIGKFFIKNIECIKTTGAHVPNGLLLYDNFNYFKSNNKIENHLIFNYICNHFKTY
jgi:hypothetical protein